MSVFDRLIIVAQDVRVGDWVECTAPDLSGLRVRVTAVYPVIMDPTPQKRKQLEGQQPDFERFGGVKIDAVFARTVTDHETARVEMTALFGEPVTVFRPTPVGTGLTF